MKPVIVCAAALVLMATRGLAADERPRPASPVVAASAGNQEQPPVLAIAAAVSDNAAPPALPVPPAPSANVPVPAALPAAPSAIVPVKRHFETHKFLDMRNSLALGAVAISLTADALSTQKGLSHPGFYEMNPLARPFVQSRAGAAVYSAGSLGLVAAGMYLAHRTNHHKVERFLPLAIAGWEGVLSARNYHVIAVNTR